MARSNYDVTRDSARQLFLRYDQETMIRRFGLDHDAAYLYLPFVGRNYRVDRRTGVVAWSDDGFRTAHEADFNEALSICDALCCSKEGCRLAGTFCTVNQLKGVVQSSRVGDGIFQPAAQRFDGRTAQLARACSALGGVPEGRGDVAFRLYPFPFLPVLFQFWSSDEDFPASLTILWDENTLDFVRYETTYYIAGHLLRRLLELMGE